MLAYVDMGLFILMLVVLAGVTGVAVVGFARVATKKRRRWALIVLPLLVLVVANPGFPNGLRLWVALLMPVFVSGVVFLPRRWSDSGDHAQGGLMAGLLAFAGSVLLAWIVLSGMNSMAGYHTSYQLAFEIESGEAVAVREITIPDLAAGAELRDLRVSANVPAVIERKPTDDLTCATCDAHYRAVFILDQPLPEADTTVSATLDASIEVRHRDVDNFDPDLVVFDVDEVPMPHHRIDFADTYSTVLSADDPWKLLKISTAIPADAMKSDDLAEWPAFWAVVEATQYGADPPQSRNTSYERVAPQGCLRDTACEFTVYRLLESPDEGISSTVEVQVEGSSTYLGDSRPDPGTTIDLSLDTPVSWRSHTIAGHGPASAEVYGLFVEQSVMIDGYDGSTLPVVVAQIQVSSPPKPGPSVLRLGDCRIDECWVGFHVEGDWTAVVHIGFFSDESSDLTTSVGELTITELLYSEDEG